MTRPIWRVRAATVVGLSPEMSLSVTPASVKRDRASRARRGGAARAGRTAPAARTPSGSSGGIAGVAQRRLRAGTRAKSITRRPSSAHWPSSRAISVATGPLATLGARAQRPRARRARSAVAVGRAIAQPAPAQLGRERHLLGDRRASRALVGRAQRVRAARGERRAEPGSRRARSHARLVGERLDPDQLDQRRRQRARLVEAQHVDAAHRLDRVRALDERLAAGQADDGQRVGDGDHHHQALRDERDEHGRGARRLDAGRAPPNVDPDADRHRDGGDRDQDAHRAHHPGHVALDRRAHPRGRLAPRSSAGWRTIRAPTRVAT